MIFKNKGEWSELYVAFKFLADGKMYAGDENGNKLDSYLEITKIFREDEKGFLNTYIRDENTKSVKIYVNSELQLEVPFSEFEDISNRMFIPIQKGRDNEDIKELLPLEPKNKQGFPIPFVQEFMNKVLMKSVSQSPTWKGDITLEIKDTHTGSSNRSSYSIKTNYPKGKATLINASEATNFTYRIDGFTDEMMEECNNINTSKKIVDRIKYIENNNCELSFATTYRPLAKQNLKRVDSLLDEIIAELLKIHYISGEVSVKNVVDELTNMDPFNFNDEYAYVYKFKKLLTACSLGLNVGKTWDGLEEATGGMIIVGPDGSIITFHLYDRNLFESFLFNSVKFERGSTSKHKFASVYKVEDRYYMNLNLQIRYF